MADTPATPAPIDWNQLSQALSAPGKTAVPPPDATVGGYANAPGAQGALPGDAAVMKAINGDDDDISNMVKGNVQGTRDAVSKYQSETAPLEEKFDEKVGEPHPTVPKEQDVLSFQDVQKSIAEGHKAAQDWASGIAILGAVLGGVAKKHTLTGAAALSGALQGLKDGDDAQAKQKMEEFKAANDAIQQHNKTLQDSYNNILNDRKLSLDEMNQQLTNKALEFGHVVDAQNAMKGDISEFVKFRDAQNKAVEKNGFLSDKVYQSSRDIAEVRGYTGDQFINFMKTTSPKSADVMEKVKMIGDYDLRGTSAYGMSKDDPKTDAILTMVKKYNPNFSQRTWDALDAYAKRGAGTAASAAFADKYKAIDQAFNHIVLLRQRTQELGNNGLKGINQLANMTSEQIQNNPRTDALYQYKTVAEQLVQEYTKATSGAGGGTADDREIKRGILDESASTETINKTLDDIQRVMGATKDAQDVQLARIMPDYGLVGAPVVGAATTQTLSNIQNTPATAGTAVAPSSNDGWGELKVH